jgi:hypothetical protein
MPGCPPCCEHGVLPVPQRYGCKECRTAHLIGGALHPILAHELTRQDLECLRDLRPLNGGPVRRVLDATLVATVKLEHETNQGWSERCAQQVRDLLSSETIVREMENDPEFRKQVHEMLSRHSSSRGLCGGARMRMTISQSLLAAS